MEMEKELRIKIGSGELKKGFTIRLLALSLFILIVYLAQEGYRYFSGNYFLTTFDSITSDIIGGFIIIIISMLFIKKAELKKWLPRIYGSLWPLVKEDTEKWLSKEGDISPTFIQTLKLSVTILLVVILATACDFIVILSPLARVDLK